MDKATAVLPGGKNVNVQCRRECSIDHTLCGCVIGKEQCWKEAQLQYDTHFVFLVPEREQGLGVIVEFHHRTWDACT